MPHDKAIWFYCKATQFVKIKSFRFFSSLLLHAAARMQKPVIVMIAGPRQKSGEPSVPDWK